MVEGLNMRVKLPYWMVLVGILVLAIRSFS